MDVVFYEAFREEQEAIRKHLNPAIRARFWSGTIQESGGNVAGAAFISIRTQSRIPRHWSDVKAVLTRSRGYDHLLGWYGQGVHGKRAGHLGSYCARAVAEQAALMMLMLMRKAKKQLRQFDSFDRDGLTGLECAGKLACVVGVGCIGEEIAGILKALKMRVCGVDIVKRSKGLEYVSLKEGVKRADVLFCALPLTEKTRSLLGWEVLSNSKRGLFLINIGRAEITPAADLKQLLKEGRIKAAALDVFEDEPQLALHLRKKSGNVSRNNRIILGLKGLDNVVLTPHNAFNSEEALDEKARQTARAVEMYLSRGRFPNPLPHL